MKTNKANTHSHKKVSLSNISKATAEVISKPNPMPLMRRIRNFYKRYINIQTFAASGLIVQVVVLLIFSLLFILGFGLLYENHYHSFNLFMSPTAILDSSTAFEWSLGFVELIIGLFLGGALISIITSTLSQLITAVNNGFIRYKGKNHTIIINSNFKLSFILDELNIQASEQGKNVDIVIYLPYNDDIFSYSNNLATYSNLIINVLAGDPLKWQTYDRLNINCASRIILLDDESVQNECIKISRYIYTHTKFQNNKAQLTIDAEDGPDPKLVYNAIFQGKSQKYNLIQGDDILEGVMSRTLVDYDYFKIFSELLSFDGWEFHIVRACDYFDTDTMFGDAVLQFDRALLVGVVSDGRVDMNPTGTGTGYMIDSQEDSLILIAKNSRKYKRIKSKPNTKGAVKIAKPYVKDDKKICIVGDYEHLELSKITEFLTPKSIADHTKIVCDDDIYSKEILWNTIILEDPDVIILDLEDDQEFVLTMYLQDLYKDRPEFLQKIVNIIHDPDIASLLIGDKQNKNIIISERLVAKYMTQIVFSRHFADIFSELTSPNGSEFYVLHRRKYPDIFDMDYSELRANLMHSGMVYIGSFDSSDNFVFNLHDTSQNDKIVVLCEGVR